MTGEPHSVLDVQATLGEGPVWVKREQALYFVDIKNHRVHRFDPQSGEQRSWTAPCQVGWVLPAEDGTFLAGLQHGLARFDPANGMFAVIATPEASMPGNRLNDATVDADGRVHFGSMDDGEEATTGRLYRLDGGAVQDSGLDPVCITNGPAISPDGRTLYHTDTLGRVIHAVPLNEDGSCGEPRVFATVDAADGWPDGSVCDAEGHVWIGLWGGWRARRYAPDGRIVGEVRFPCANITKIAFGGADLRTAYATTARKGLDAAELEAQPLAGNLFAFDAGVAGLPGHLARLG
ncbi:SMP-30/gluconolactonase/LRE family protein [uncultured Sphingomonas sp.]|uniref:SMP-30/gluconolactonase/LRE family protein n=1 Tax=uncultured Sphingomonas sp. TaxID=158754 RepID=UPI0025E22E98|nr:SMP-30/gluconolactonase/LRE family protein [uncultured Sphingomonas sp.]